MTDEDVLPSFESMMKAAKSEKGYNNTSLSDSEDQGYKGKGYGQNRGSRGYNNGRTTKIKDKPYHIGSNGQNFNPTDGVRSARVKEHPDAKPYRDDKADKQEIRDEEEKRKQEQASKDAKGVRDSKIHPIHGFQRALPSFQDMMQSAEFAKGNKNSYQPRLEKEERKQEYRGKVAEQNISNPKVGNVLYDSRGRPLGRLDSSNTDNPDRAGRMTFDYQGHNRRDQLKMIEDGSLIRTGKKLANGQEILLNPRTGQEETLQLKQTERLVESKLYPGINQADVDRAFDMWTYDGNDPYDSRGFKEFLTGDYLRRVERGGKDRSTAESDAVNQMMRKDIQDVLGPTPDSEKLNEILELASSREGVPKEKLTDMQIMEALKDRLYSKYSDRREIIPKIIESVTYGNKDNIKRGEFNQKAFDNAQIQDRINAKVPEIYERLMKDPMYIEMMNLPEDNPNRTTPENILAIAKEMARKEVLKPIQRDAELKAEGDARREEEAEEQGEFVDDVLQARDTPATLRQQMGESTSRSMSDENNKADVEFLDNLARNFDPTDNSQWVDLFTPEATSRLNDIFSRQVERYGGAFPEKIRRLNDYVQAGSIVPSAFEGMYIPDPKDPTRLGRNPKYTMPTPNEIYSNKFKNLISTLANAARWGPEGAEQMGDLSKEQSEADQLNNQRPMSKFDMDAYAWIRNRAKELSQKSAGQNRMSREEASAMVDQAIAEFNSMHGQENPEYVGVTRQMFDTWNTPAQIRDKDRRERSLESDTKKRDHMAELNTVTGEEHPNAFVPTRAEATELSDNYGSVGDAQGTQVLKEIATSAAQRNAAKQENLDPEYRGVDAEMVDPIEENRRLAIEDIFREYFQPWSEKMIRDRKLDFDPTDDEKERYNKMFYNLYHDADGNLTKPARRGTLPLERTPPVPGSRDMDASGTVTMKDVKDRAASYGNAHADKHKGATPEALRAFTDEGGKLDEEGLDMYLAQKQYDDEMEAGLKELTASKKRRGMSELGAEFYETVLPKILASRLNLQGRYVKPSKPMKTSTDFLGTKGLTKEEIAALAKGGYEFEGMSGPIAPYDAMSPRQWYDPRKHAAIADIIGHYRDRVDELRDAAVTQNPKPGDYHRPQSVTPEYVGRTGDVLSDPKKMATPDAEIDARTTEAGGNGIKILDKQQGDDDRYVLGASKDGVLLTKKPDEVPKNVQGIRQDSTPKVGPKTDKAIQAEADAYAQRKIKEKADKQRKEEGEKTTKEFKESALPTTADMLNEAFRKNHGGMSTYPPMTTAQMIRDPYRHVNMTGAESKPIDTLKIYNPEVITNGEGVSVKNTNIDGPSIRKTALPSAAEMLASPETNWFAKAPPTDVETRQASLDEFQDSPQKTLDDFQGEMRTTPMKPSRPSQPDTSDPGSTPAQGPGTAYDGHDGTYYTQENIPQEVLRGLDDRIQQIEDHGGNRGHYVSTPSGDEWVDDTIGDLSDEDIQAEIEYYGRERPDLRGYASLERDEDPVGAEMSRKEELDAKVNAAQQERANALRDARAAQPAKAPVSGYNPSPFSTLGVNSASNDISISNPADLRDLTAYSRTFTPEELAVLTQKRMQDDGISNEEAISRLGSAHQAVDAHNRAIARENFNRPANAQKRLIKSIDEMMAEARPDVYFAKTNGTQMSRTRATVAGGLAGKANDLKDKLELAGSSMDADRAANTSERQRFRSDADEHVSTNGTPSQMHNVRDKMTSAKEGRSVTWDDANKKELERATPPEFNKAVEGAQDPNTPLEGGEHQIPEAALDDLKTSNDDGN